MDPVTHGLSGALAARAFLPRLRDERTLSAARWAVLLGSIFPDIDVLAKPFDPDDFATIRVHRSLTHSLVCLPVWAFLLALLVKLVHILHGPPVGNVPHLALPEDAIEFAAAGQQANVPAVQRQHRSSSQLLLLANENATSIL